MPVQFVLCRYFTESSQRMGARPFVLEEEPFLSSLLPQRTDEAMELVRNQQQGCARQKLHSKLELHFGEERKGKTNNKKIWNISRLKIWATHWYIMVFFLPFPFFMQTAELFADPTTNLERTEARCSLLIDTLVDWKKHRANPILLCVKRAEESREEERRERRGKREDAGGSVSLLKENVNWSHPNLSVGKKFN